MDKGISQVDVQAWFDRHIETLRTQVFQLLNKCYIDNDNDVNKFIAKAFDICFTQAALFSTNCAYELIEENNKKLVQYLVENGVLKEEDKTEG
jgi:polyhydroxyalkanoate synthesis regulator phasin